MWSSTKITVFRGCFIKSNLFAFVLIFKLNTNIVVNLNNESCCISLMQLCMYVQVTISDFLGCEFCKLNTFLT